MDGKRLIERIRLTNFLSFGPDGEEIALEPLNVLIGPNSSGKSNFLEAVSFLEILPQTPRFSPGISEFLWQGRNASRVAEIDVTVCSPPGRASLRYSFSFGSLKERLEVIDESISELANGGGEPEFLYRLETGVEALIEIVSAPTSGARDSQRTHEMLPRGSIQTSHSILAQFRDPVRYPELSYLADQFMRIHMYIEGWRLDRSEPPKTPVDAGEQEVFLMESGRNLALVLNELFAAPAKKAEILNKLKRFNERIDDIILRIRGGVVGIEFHERGLSDTIPARRMSDGTLRFLMLLAILCHPNPPPLVCLDEPEHGLHPDALHLVAGLLREASERCQLIVTTHSDVLVSALSDVPEAVIVCERDERGTHLRRLDGSRLQAWLEEYTLGDLWQMGEIGGRQ